MAKHEADGGDKCLAGGLLDEELASGATPRPWSGIRKVGDGGTAATVKREPKRDSLGRSYATGRRKNAVARVWIKPGKGDIQVNGKRVGAYFARPVLRMLITQPFLVADRYNQFDVYCTVTGGGLSGQAGAVRHGISRALTYYEPELLSILKVAGFAGSVDLIPGRPITTVSPGCVACTYTFRVSGGSQQ